MIWSSSGIRIIVGLLGFSASSLLLAKDRPEARLVPRMGHIAPVVALAFSPDGRFLATGSHDSEVCIWEVRSGRELRRLRGHLLPIRALSFLSGDRIVTSSDDGTARVWDVATGDEALRLRPDPPVPIFSLAVTPDNRRIITGDLNGMIRVWNLNGHEEHSWSGHLVGILSLAVSLDSQLLVSGSADTSARVWNIDTGEEISRWNAHSHLVPSVRFSPDSDAVLSGSLDGRAHLWSSQTGREVRRFGNRSFGIHAARISPDSRLILAVGQKPRLGQEEDSGEARLWDATTGEERVPLPIYDEPLVSAAFSPDSKSVAAGLQKGAVVIWDTATGEEVRRLGGSTAMPLHAVASRDGHILLTAHRAQDIQAWNLQTGRPISCVDDLRDGKQEIRDTRISPDGKLILLVDFLGAKIWSLETCEVERIFREDYQEVLAADLAIDGKTVLTGNSDGSATLWDVKSEEVKLHLEGHEAAVGFVTISPDGGMALTGDEGGTARLWELSTGRQTHLLRVHRHPVVTGAFSPDGRWAITATASAVPAGEAQARTMTRHDPDFLKSILDQGGEIRFWNVATGREIFEAITYPVRAVQFSKDGRFVLVGTGDGAVRCLEIPSGQETCRFEVDVPLGLGLGFLGADSAFATGLDGLIRTWDLKSGRELARLASFSDGTWAVVDANGRFDATDPGDLPGLSWVITDDPMSPLPVEIFLREYFEPRLLPRLLAREPLPPITSIAEINRAQPRVRFSSVEPEGTESKTVRISVEVASTARISEEDNKLLNRNSGAKDLRLFRNGQLVSEKAVRLDEKGEATLVFTGIRLPQAQGVDEIEFSAYAFSDDGVKSETARKRHLVSTVKNVDSRTIFLVHIGVSSFENPDTNLQYAATDARTLQEVLRSALQGTLEEGDEIVSILLVSENVRSGATISLPAATKSRIEAVLQRLAGRQINPQILTGIPGADRLRTAGPDDSLIVTFSTHGEMDERRMFYLSPHDTGPQPTLERNRLISANELSSWIREIDAGEIAILLDTCHSAASIDTGTFKPGPLDSRSFGQLAYDKAMRILAASQPDNLAYESDFIRHGFLTYSLVQDGLGKALADFDPEDGEITLGEWLRYGERRVPELYLETLVQSKGDRGAVLLPEMARKPEMIGQRPVLFDFSRKPDQMVLAITP